MRSSARAVAIGTLALALAPQAHAVAPRGAATHAPAQAARESGLVAMTQLKRPLRSAIRLDHTPLRPAAWSRFVAAAGGRWEATWDHATAVPSRIFGEGIAVPGASADPDVAARAARALIAAHLDLLAPGASIDDLELVSNHVDGELRSVGFVQRWRGARVLGGQVSVRI